LGSNSTLSVAFWPGPSVSGRSPPEIAKPVPDSAAALTVTAAVPVEYRISDCVVSAPTFTLPKTRLDALRLSSGAEAPSCKPKVSVTPPTLAVNVAVCTVVTGETVAVKSTLFASAGMVTEDGTATALLVLARLTPRPLLPVAAFSVTVQLSVPAPVIELLVQLSALSTGTPVPLSATDVEDPLGALLVTVS